MPDPGGGLPPRQLGLDLPAPDPARGERDFLISAGNAAAFTMVTERASDWPEGKLVLCGPAGCGKSHLARIWQARQGARMVAAAALTAEVAATLADRPLCLEDLHALPPAAEEVLFHLHNALRAAGLPLLITSRVPPAALPFELPDLASRLQAATVIFIDNPDDRLLAQVLVKLFADRQLIPAPDLIPWLTARMERSFARAEAIVARLDAAALAGRRKVNRKLAQDILDNGPAGLR